MMRYVVWPAVWAMLVTCGWCLALPALVGCVSKRTGKAVGRWLKRRALAIVGGLYVAYVVWQWLQR